MTESTAAASLPHRHPPARVRPTRSPLPGLALTGAIAAASYGIRLLPGMANFSPMIIAIVLGVGFHNTIRTPAIAKAGVTFSLKRLLRLAIVLLGLQLTFQQVAAVGGTGMAIIAATLLATFTATKAVGRLLGVEPRLAELIAAGTSICGASAVVAANSVTDAPDEDVAYAIACVTVFGCLSMFIYPALPHLLGLAPREFGLWTGASLHEIAQVVAAAFQNGRESGEFATIAKLSRVMLLAPLVLGMGLLRSRHTGASHARAPIPWFVLGFVALIGVNSLGVVPPAAKTVLVPGTTFLLTVALAAMGLETDIRKLKACGLRPFALGSFAWLFISGFSLLLVKAFY
jgi:uncharacterized integral membrane protein (TIGR00698 family)